MQTYQPDQPDQTSSCTGQLHHASDTNEDLKCGCEGLYMVISHNCQLLANYNQFQQPLHHRINGFSTATASSRMQ